MRIHPRTLAIGIVAALVLAACGGDDSDGASGGGGELPECDLAALDAASKPVEITFWHAMTLANEEALVALTNEFNESQSDVKVALVNQNSYKDNLTKLRAGLRTKDLPDLVQIEDTGLQFMIDTGATLPAQSCIEADRYDTSDFVQRVLSYYTVRDVLWPMPFNVSNPVLYYDRALFEKAGLDPDAPPATLPEIRDVSEKLVAAGVVKRGIALKSDSWMFEQMVAKGGGLIVNNGNGRKERATASAFDNRAGREVFEWLADMDDRGLLLNTGSSAIDHFFAVGRGQVAMTIDTSAAFGRIAQVLGTGQFSAVELGVAPMPGAEGDGGVLVGGAALFMLRNSSPAEQAAAWEFVKFLDDPKTQSQWSTDTGYLPLRKSATTLEPLATRWAEQPYYRIPYDQLLEGPENDATAGPVVGAYGDRGVGMRGAIIDAIESLYTRDVPPDTALQNAADEADAAIADYNRRVGA
jgi:sn-glycerol 3-phosphate transport system substrate-binding protein